MELVSQAGWRDCQMDEKLCRVPQQRVSPLQCAFNFHITWGRQRHYFQLVSVSLCNVSKESERRGERRVRGAKNNSFFVIHYSDCLSHSQRERGKKSENTRGGGLISLLIPSVSNKQAFIRNISVFVVLRVRTKDEYQRFCFFCVSRRNKKQHLALQTHCPHFLS